MAAAVAVSHPLIALFVDSVAVLQLFVAVVAASVISLTTPSVRESSVSDAAFLASFLTRVSKSSKVLDGMSASGFNPSRTVASPMVELNACSISVPFNVYRHAAKRTVP